MTSAYICCFFFPAAEVTEQIQVICPCSLTPASTEKVGSSKKWNTWKTKTQSKHRIAKNNPTRFTRKNTTKSKNKSHKNNLDKFWLFCVFLVCFFLCALVLYFLNRYILYAVRLKKPGIQKGSKQTPYSYFWLERRKEESKVYERKGGQAHPSLEYIFWISGFDIWLDFRHGWTYGWIWLDTHTIIHHPTKSFLYVLVYKQILPYIFFGNKWKRKFENVWMGGGQAHPSLEYISGLIMIGCGPG